MSTMRGTELTKVAEEDMAIYRSRSSGTIDQIEAKLRGSGWDMLDLEEQGNIMYPVTRLHGEDDFTSADMRKRIDRMSDTARNRSDGRHIAAY